MLKNITQRDDGWIEYEGNISTENIRFLAQHVNTSRQIIRGVTIHSSSVMTVAIAKGFNVFNSLTNLEIWCDVTRSAMRHIITIPYLRSLYIITLTRSNTLADFSKAKSLDTFRCGAGLNESDFLAVIHCRSLRILVAQSSNVTPGVIKELSDMPQLVNLDIEGSDFDDEMAKVISCSKTLLSLEVAGTLLTGKGLETICGMKQLQVLDLWNTKINLDDLDLLVKLPKLEYLSIGHTIDQLPMFVDKLIEKLQALPSLKKIWIDGVKITEKQRVELEKRYETVQISPPEADG